MVVKNTPFCFIVFNITLSATHYIGPYSKLKWILKKKRKYLSGDYFMGVIRLLSPSDL